MRISILAGLVLLAGFTSFAEPEIKGTASELAHYLNAVPKTVRITGEAEIRVPAHRAILSLRVVTENRSLQEALRANLEIRGKLADYLKNLGMPAERIQAAKFSSTPKFGMFGEKAKSYRVENVMRISVQDEKEFQAATGVVDKWSEVQFDGAEFEYADKELQKQNAIAKACENAGERLKIYEEKIGVKLVPETFSEGEVEKRNAGPANYGLSKAVGYDRSLAPGASMVSEPAAEEAISSFGEIVYTAKVSVEYTVQPK
ncbi:MAG TPA: SIMPL domain-containing protein [Verrucomicrobiae bacterium]|nr:SIMPL domain-containing protein [Verrucomicrobiae bacterium]